MLRNFIQIVDLKNHIIHCTDSLGLPNEPKLLKLVFIDTHTAVYIKCIKEIY